MGNKEMRNFFDMQGRTRVFAEAHIQVRRRRQTRGEQSRSEKEPFLAVNYIATEI